MVKLLENPMAALASVGLVTLSILWLPPVTAAQQGTAVDIRAWNTANLYDGWSAEDLLGEPVYGTGGAVLGSVMDLAIGADGSIRRVVVEGGGVRATQAPRFEIPWNAVKRVGSAGIDLPVGDGNLGGHGQFPKAGEANVTDEAVALTAMIGAGVQADGTDFGAIRDVIFDQNDTAVALVVVPAAGAGAPSGPIAFPYNPTYFERQTATYASPYPRETLNTLRPFDYDAVR